MKKEIYLFEGQKVIGIDRELFRCYEIYVDRLSENRLRYLPHVLDLTEDMTEMELSERLSETLYEEIYMATAMEEDLIIAIKKMLADDGQDVKVEESAYEMPKEICELLANKKLNKLIVSARMDWDISKERIEKCFAGLYKSIRCSNLVSWLGKTVEDDVVKEIHIVLEEAKIIDLKSLIRNFVYEVFGYDEPERIINLNA